MLEHEFSEAGMGPPSNVVESASIFAILQLLQTSDAVAMLPESVVRDHLRAGLLVEIPGLIKGEISGFGILRRKGEPPATIALEFSMDLREIAHAKST